MRQPKKERQRFNPGDGMSLDLEKINSQRITGLEESIRYVERKVDDLSKQLPNIVQDAVKQAVETFGFTHGHTSSNGNGNGKKESNPILTLFITIILAMSTIFAQQIYFSYTQNEKTAIALKEHTKEAHIKDIELAVTQNEIKWVKFMNGIKESNGELKEVSK